MISTTDDLYRWILALKGEQMLSKDAKEKFFDLLVPRNANGLKRMSFLGSNGVFTAAFRWYIDEGSIIIGFTKWCPSKPELREAG